MVIEKHLRELAQYHQVCCITHLPQIASRAHAQFVVEKSTSDNRTLTKIEEVTGVQREAEWHACSVAVSSLPPFERLPKNYSSEDPVLVKVLKLPGIRLFQVTLYPFDRQS